MDYQGGDTTLTNCTLSGNFVTGFDDPSPYGGGGALDRRRHTGADQLHPQWQRRGCKRRRRPGKPDTDGSGLRELSHDFPPHLGGGLKDEQSVTSLTNCTVSGNTAYGGIGGVANYATLSMSNTIVAGNNGGDFSGSYTGSNNLIGGNPLLSPLGDYGGPTATMALLPGSPAIGGGTSTGAPTFDQRGQPRSGHVDIGAFQSQGFTITPSPAATLSRPRSISRSRSRWLLP